MLEGSDFDRTWTPQSRMLTSSYLVRGWRVRRAFAGCAAGAVQRESQGGVVLVPVRLCMVNSASWLSVVSWAGASEFGS